MRQILIRTVLAAICAFAATVQPVYAEYPEKPVTFIVPWPPGGEEDVLTRMIAEEFQSMYGVPAAVVNKPGSGGGPFPGAIEVASAPADGYTIGSFVIGVPVVGPGLGIPELNPDPFVPVGIFFTYPFLIAAGKDAPYDTLEELAAYAKENDVALGHFGAGLVPTRVTFGLADSMGFSFASDAAYDNIDCNTLASGDVDVVNSVVGLIGPCLNDIKVLASVTKNRISLIPDVPTVSELVPALNIVLWNGLFVRDGTPYEVIRKIEAAAQRALASKKAIEYAKANGIDLYWQDQAASQAQIRQDIKTFHNLSSQ